MILSLSKPEYDILVEFLTAALAYMQETTVIPPTDYLLHPSDMKRGVTQLHNAATKHMVPTGNTCEITVDDEDTYFYAIAFIDSYAEQWDEQELKTAMSVMGITWNDEQIDMFCKLHTKLKLREFEMLEFLHRHK